MVVKTAEQLGCGQEQLDTSGDTTSTPVARGHVARMRGVVRVGPNVRGT